MSKYLIALIFPILLPAAVSAATLVLEPATATFGPGDTVYVSLRVEPTECINTVEAELIFPKNQLSFVDFLTGDSLINLWVDKPDTTKVDDINQKGAVYLAGGIPGGYCGKIPGDPGDPGLIGKAVFRIPSMRVGEDSETNGPARIQFGDRTHVYLNDGAGTDDIVEKKISEITIGKTRVNSEDPFRADLRSDNTPPEPFVVELLTSPNNYEKKYYINFFATDKQTGIDHYEVMEIRPEEMLENFSKLSWLDKYAYKLRFYNKPKPEWKIARTPYLLEDQSLNSIIKVRALDNALNERLVEYIPPLDKRSAESVKWKYLVIIGMILAVLVGILLVYILFSSARYILRRIFHRPDAGPDGNKK